VNKDTKKASVSKTGARVDAFEKWHRPKLVRLCRYADQGKYWDYRSAIGTEKAPILLSVLFGLMS
jgi:hypothetical protein